MIALLNCRLLHAQVYRASYTTSSRLSLRVISPTGLMLSVRRITILGTCSPGSSSDSFSSSFLPPLETINRPPFWNPSPAKFPSMLLALAYQWHGNRVAIGEGYCCYSVTTSAIAFLVVLLSSAQNTLQMLYLLLDHLYC